MLPHSVLGVRGVSKSRFAPARGKKVARALCTVFEDTTPSPFFSVKPWLLSPSSRPTRRNGVTLPALARCLALDSRDTPSGRRATPIKDAGAALRAAHGRHRMQGELDALAEELGTVQLAARGAGGGAGGGGGGRSPEAGPEAAAGAAGPAEEQGAAAGGRSGGRGAAGCASAAMQDD
ncbi:hypothetical protein HYH03_014977 [Edaphochlamys debaryana]|uniref:Uncharacterized protein n=1 Tax=Edaphochlamys debaryana TaxID=47281 RepID=A0A836BRP7_9CHLO|nr:hypothetical protein HYH03_014977 [Edaphochlamys debaryana]|eukprot:KAG2486400.1 hypothetical protein HYH03_014977 [Edaphochlamys debaryana]